MLKKLSPFILVLALLSLIFTLVLKYEENTIDRFADIGVKLTIPYQNNSSFCTPPRYVFPKEALESDTPLPEKVRESFKSTINITVQFVFHTSGIYFSSRTMEFGGSGFMAEGIYVSARHIFFNTILDLDSGRRPIPFTLDKNGLPHSSHYNYCFYGTADVNGKLVTFPLELIAMGNPYRNHDFAVFRAVNGPRLKSLEFEETASLRDIVYSSGRVPSFNLLGDDLNPIRKNVLVDFLNYTFTGHISAILTDMPHNRSAGLQKIYRIGRSTNNVAPGYPGNNVEPGYSGGPVLNQNGKVIGMSVLLSPGFNFSRAISAKDIRLFIAKLKKEKRIK